MDTRDFEAGLQRDGYLETKIKSVEPGYLSKPHSHPFDTRLLVLDGEATIVYGDGERTCKAGDVLEINAGVEHFERHGESPFRAFVGLRHHAVPATESAAADAVPATTLAAARA